jgi:hypothetical protein
MASAVESGVKTVPKSVAIHCNPTIKPGSSKRALRQSAP